MQSLQLTPLQKQIQKQILTQRQIQAIKMLQLTRQELETLIREELEDNPALELEEEAAVTTIDDVSDADVQNVAKSIEEEIFTKVFDQGDLDVDWNDKFDTGNYLESIKGYNEDAQSFETYTASKESLYEHLLTQLKHWAGEEDEYAVGEYLIGCIDRNGYLHRKDLEAASEKFNMDLEFVEGVRELLLNFDPAGVGALTIKESLLVQLGSLDLDEDTHMILEGILEEYSDYLAKNKIPELAKKIGVSVEQVYLYIDLLRKLTLFPAANYTVDEENFFVIPDVFVRKIEDQYCVELNKRGYQQLNVNDYYRSIVENKEDFSSSREDFKFIKEKVNNAYWLKKCVDDRSNTILKVAEAIVERQIDFFEFGIKHLKPLIQRDIAEELSFSEATISRVTTGKYMDTPLGTLEFKYFFSTGLGNDSGDDTSSKAIQQRIKEVVDGEDKAKPHSDDKLKKLLSDEGISISRRAIQKYRTILGIPNSSKRKMYE